MIGIVVVLSGDRMRIVGPLPRTFDVGVRLQPGVNMVYIYMVILAFNGRLLLSDCVYVSRIPVSAYSVDRLDCGFGSILYSD